MLNTKYMVYIWKNKFASVKVAESFQTTCLDLG